MSDKIHANWIASTVPTWEEIKPPHTLERYIINKQAAEINALRKRVQELEANHDQYRMMWLREKEKNDLRKSNGKAKQPGITTAPSEVYENAVSTLAAIKEII